MRKQSLLNYLVPLIGLLAMITASAGLLVRGEDEPFVFISVHDENVELFGRGLYANDTLMAAAGFKGTDLITLFVGIPLLALSFRSYQQRKIRGGILLAGVISYFLYYGASMTFAAAYNPLFLVYTALFSSSLFVFIVIISSIDPHQLETRDLKTMSNIRIAIYFFIAGTVVLVLWGMEIVSGLITGEPPILLAHYTTAVTHAIDMGVIAPTAFYVGIKILHKNPNGYRFGLPLIILNVLIGLCVISQTIMQISYGVELHPGQIIGIVGSWLVLGLMALLSGISLYKNLCEIPEIV